MEEALVADNSIAAVVSLGLHLATTLQTYVTAFKKAGGDFQDIVLTINSTASALTQLQRIIDGDKAVEPPGKVLRDEGREHIMALAAQCRKVYAAIPVLVTEAEHSESRRKAKLHTNHQEMPTFEVSSMSNSLKWSWLEPRIKRCQEQLKCLEIDLLFTLQLATLAHFQIRSPRRLPGTFDKELALRAVVASLRSERLKFAKTLEEKYRNSPETASSPDTDISPDADTNSVLQIDADTPGSEKPRGLAVSDDSGKRVIIKSVGERGDFSPNHQSTLPTQNTQEIANSNPVAALSDTNSDCETFVADSDKVIGNEREDVTAEIVLKRAEKTPVDNNFSVLDYRYKPGFLSWLKALLRHDRKFTQDCKSETLVAYSINHNTKTLLELPLGHHGLTDQLKRTVNSNKGSIYNQLVSREKDLDWVIATAKQLDPRVRTCVAFDFRNKQSGIVFFTLGAPVQPVHLKDCIGRSFNIPFERCKLEPLREIINQLFLQFDELRPRVSASQYDLLLVEGDVTTIIIPQLMESTIKPGSSLSMQMWRPPALPPALPSRFIGPPPVWPGPRPGWQRPGPPFSRNAVTVLQAGTRKRRSTYGIDSLPDKIKYLEIDHELKDMGVDIDFAAQVQRAEVGFGEVLKTLTNATDDLGELRYKICGDDSDSDSDSDSTSLADGDD